MDFGWNIDTLASMLPCVVALAAIGFLLKISWKQYGLLLALSAVTGLLICILFVVLNLYSFPFRLFPQAFRFPILTLLLVFPAYAALAIRYSPRRWGWKIPYYWVLVHLVTLVEALAEKFTNIVQYSPHWFLWESYALWWIFLLAFEWLGGKIVTAENRVPVDAAIFRYGKIGFYIVHAVLIATFFLAGLYAGGKLFSQTH